MDRNLPQEIEVSNAGLTVHQHHHHVAARPLLATEANCAAVLGLEVRAFRRALRLLKVPTVKTPDGVAALVEDVERAMRDRGRPLEKAEPKKAVDEPEDADAELLRKAGVKLRSVGVSRP